MANHAVGWGKCHAPQLFCRADDCWGALRLPPAYALIRIDWLEKLPENFVQSPYPST